MKNKISVFGKTFLFVRNYIRYHGDTFKQMENIINKEKFRLKRKEGNPKYTPGVVYLKILGNGAVGSPNSLLLSTDHHKYLFNCGESTQRVANEFKVKVTKLKHIFVTTPNWSNMGGLPGMILTVQTIGVPDMTIHGPIGTANMFTGLQEFVSLKQVCISSPICDPSKPYKDSIMTVFYVPIKKTPTQEQEDTISNDETNSVVNENDKRINPGKRDARKRIKLNLKNERISDSMSYVCELHARQGKLSLEKCLDKGVPPGPLLGDLKNGKDVTLPDGTIVKSSEVCGESSPGPVIIVADCPTLDHLKSFLSAEIFKKYQASTALDKDDVAFCIFHFTPQNIINNPDYKQWMEEFGPDTEHVVINETNNGYNSEAIYAQQYKLHMIESRLFPKLGEVVDKRMKNPSNESLPKSEKFPKIHEGEILNVVNLQPVKQFSLSSSISMTPDVYVVEALNMDGLPDALAELQTTVNRMDKSLPKEEYPKIVMLGTGSAIPSKTRNTSGILLRVDEQNSMILDCGEGTLGQLTRFYGRSKIHEILSTVKGIYVSHYHADHHIGLIGLINERFKATKDPFYLFAPNNIISWLQLYDMVFEPIMDKFHAVLNDKLILHQNLVSDSVNKKIRHTLNIENIQTIPVKHCALSYGVSVTLNNGKKIVYSGDTMPCDSLVKLGKNCDLLIHEATMENDLLQDARDKMHSTIGQAIKVGQDMNAGFTLLTHFSQRYSKMALLPQDDSYDPTKVGVAFDNMEITFPRLPIIPLITPCLKLIFGEYLEEMEERTLKYRKKE